MSTVGLSWVCLSTIGYGTLMLSIKINDFSKHIDELEVFEYHKTSPYFKSDTHNLYTLKVVVYL